MGARLRTPLQIERHLTLAFEEGFRVGGEKPLTTEVVETVLSNALDDLEPRLTRHGCDVRSIADEFRMRPSDVRLFLQAQRDQHPFYVVAPLWRSRGVTARPFAGSLTERSHRGQVINDQNRG
jgi:hypothetical protein